MDKIRVNLNDLSAFLDLLKVFASETKNPVLTDCVWNLSDLLLDLTSGECIRTEFEAWSGGQVEFYEPPVENEPMLLTDGIDNQYNER
jgi:hypothetical protein